MSDAIGYVAPMVVMLYVGIFAFLTKYLSEASEAKFYNEEALAYVLSSRAMSGSKTWHYLLLSTRVITALWFFSISFCYRIWWYQVVKEGRGGEYF